MKGVITFELTLQCNIQVELEHGCQIEIWEDTLLLLLFQLKIEYVGGATTTTIGTSLNSNADRHK